MDTGSSGTDWRTQLPPDTRQRLVNKIMDTLKRHLPISGQEGLQELQLIASRFEEKIYTAATSESDYLRKISLKMLTMETKSQNTMATIVPVNSASNSKNPPDAARLDSTTQTGNANKGDWQEEVYQKIKAMKEAYLLDLNEMYQKIAGKLQQLESLPQQPKIEQLDKLKAFKTMLERTITFLQVPKSNILPAFKDKLGAYEKQILHLLNTYRPRKPGPPLQPGQQLPPPHMHSMQQTRQSQSQINQVQPHENQVNPQLQSMNVQSSVASMQQNNVPSLHHNSLSSLSGVSNAPQSMINSLPSSNIDSGRGNALNILQEVALGSVQQNPVSATQQVNINSLSSQSGMNALQANLTTLQSSSNMLQHQMMHPQLQQLYQQRLQHLLLQLHQQRQQQLQQLHQQTQQVNINSLSSQSGMNALQANPTPLPANPASNSENPLDEGIYALEDIIRLLEI